MDAANTRCLHTKLGVDAANTRCLHTELGVDAANTRCLHTEHERLTPNKRETESAPSYENCTVRKFRKFNNFSECIKGA